MVSKLKVISTIQFTVELSKKYTEKQINEKELDYKELDKILEDIEKLLKKKAKILSGDYDIIYEEV